MKSKAKHTALSLLPILFHIFFGVMSELAAEPVLRSGAMPFRHIANTIVIQAEIQNHKGLLLIDTGCREFILNSNYFSADHESIISKEINSLTGTLSLYGPELFSFELGAIHLNQEFGYLGDLKNLEKKRNIKLLGIIGYDLLRQFELVIDYPRSKLEFFIIDQKGDKLAEPTSCDQAAEKFPLRLKEHLPCIELKHRDLHLIVAIDSGASINVLDLQTRRRIPAKYFKAQPKQATLRSFGNDSIKVYQVETFTGLQIDQHSLPSIPMVSDGLTRLNLDLKGPWIDGIFSPKIFHQHRFSINYQKKALLIWISEEETVANGHHE